MGDLSAEPSMEEILSSIKRIIAEEGEGNPQRPRRPQGRGPAGLTPAPLADPDGADDAAEVLELSDPMPPTRPEPQRVQPSRVEAPAPEPRRVEPVRAEPEPPPRAHPATSPTSAEPILSADAAAASRGALDQLSRLMVKPEPASDGTLESLVRELLRPMLRDWLDARLPAIVEEMVAREIKRITGQPS